MADVQTDTALLDAEIQATEEYLESLREAKRERGDFHSGLFKLDTSGFKFTVTMERPNTETKPGDTREYVMCPEGCNTKLQVAGSPAGSQMVNTARKPTRHYMEMHEDVAESKIPELADLRKLPRA